MKDLDERLRCQGLWKTPRVYALKCISVIERIAYTYQDVPMELRRGYYRTDTHHYHNTLN